MKDEFEIWRLVFNDIAKYHEIEMYYSYHDIVVANAMLDFKNDIDNVDIPKVPKIPK